MDAANDSIPELVERLRRGDEDAMRLVFNQFYDRLVRRAARELQGRPQGARDEEDIAQSTLRSFWNALQAGRLNALDDAQSLEPLLMRMVARKAVDWLRYETADKRGGGKVRGDSAFPRAASRDEGDGSVQISGDASTPSAHAAAEEWWQHLFDQLPNDDCRRIVRERLHGVTNMVRAAPNTEKADRASWLMPGGLFSAFPVTWLRLPLRSHRSRHSDARGPAPTAYDYGRTKQPRPGIRQGSATSRNRPALRPI